MIQETDLVALLVDLTADGLCRGDVGTVAYNYNNGQTFEVEFVNAAGETLAVKTLAVSQIQKIDYRKAILHVANLPISTAA